jgi:hypothetical protein
MIAGLTLPESEPQDIGPLKKATTLCYVRQEAKKDCSVLLEGFPF